MYHRTLKHASLALVVGMAMATAGTAWAGGGGKFECRAEDEFGPRSMDAKLEKRDGRAKFSATIESDAADAGTEVSVMVGGVQVDTIILGAAPTGSTGDVSYDTNPEDDSPFPMKFNPADAGGGTNVEVGGVDCDLQSD